MGGEYERRVLREQALLPTDNAEFFYTNGFCYVCGRETKFLTSFMYSTGPTPDGRVMPNWREHMQCGHCGLVNRMRAALNVLHTLAPPTSESRIYVTEHLTSTYQWLHARYQHLQGSEYFGPDFKPGTMVDGIQHEDVMNQSFADSSFDRVLSFDVLEHVPDPAKAFREIYRVLDNGGVFLFSVPFSADSQTDIVRATLQQDGTIEHHLPAEYHGNPVDPEGGALCFRYFGWELLEQLRTIGFSRVRVLAYWSEQQGYLGKEQYMFLAEKNGGDDAALESTYEGAA
jgi:SAM-dependent methyltransferase